MWETCCLTVKISRARRVRHPWVLQRKPMLTFTKQVYNYGRKMFNVFWKLNKLWATALCLCFLYINQDVSFKNDCRVKETKCLQFNISWDWMPTQSTKEALINGGNHWSLSKCLPEVKTVRWELFTAQIHRERRAEANSLYSWCDINLHAR